MEPDMLQERSGEREALCRQIINARTRLKQLGYLEDPELAEKIAGQEACTAVLEWGIEYKHDPASDQKRQAVEDMLRAAITKATGERE